MGSADPLPRKMDEKLKSDNTQKKSSFLCLCYILRAIGAVRCRERRYTDHIFIQIYFRMHHFVVKFSKFSSPQAARGHCPPLPKILRTFLTVLSVACFIGADSTGATGNFAPVLTQEPGQTLRFAPVPFMAVL